MRNNIEKVFKQNKAEAFNINTEYLLLDLQNDKVEVGEGEDAEYERQY